MLIKTAIKLAEYAKKDKSLIPNHKEGGVTKALEKEIKELNMILPHVSAFQGFDIQNEIKEYKKLLSIYGIYVEVKGTINRND